MRFFFSFLLFFLFTTKNASPSPVEENAISYGDAGVTSYAKLGHGADMHLFLTPFITCILDQQNEKNLLDAGCGAAPYSIYAAERGAKVIGIDIQEKMIEEARKAIQQANLPIAIHLGDATDMDFQDASFDHVVSINVGCNLSESRFIPHFTEIRRVLREGGTATIAAPFSLDILFTDDTATEDLEAQIQKVLEEIGENPSSKIIQEKLQQLTPITSATFAIKNQKLTLIKDSSLLQEGQKIWRKLTHVTIPNFYHSPEEYLKAIQKAGLEIEDIVAEHFKSPSDRKTFNATNPYPTLGPAYEKHPPFIIYYLKKPTSNSHKK